MPILLPNFPVHIVLIPDTIFIFSERFSDEIRQELLSLAERSRGYIKPLIDVFSRMNHIDSSLAKDFHKHIEWLNPNSLCCELEVFDYIKDGENIFDLDQLVKELIRFFFVENRIDCVVSDLRDNLIPSYKIVSSL